MDMTLTVAIAIPPGAFPSQVVGALSASIQRHAAHCGLDWQVVIQHHSNTNPLSIV